MASLRLLARAPRIVGVRAFSAVAEVPPSHAGAHAAPHPRLQRPPLRLFGFQGAYAHAMFNAASEAKVRAAAARRPNERDRSTEW
jgi:hypothetical protein